MKNAQTIQAELRMPFPADQISWKPGMVKGARALAMAYISAREVMDRLDDVVGMEGWSDDYQVLENGSTICRLQLNIEGQWVVKGDVGSLSEQPDDGDKVKAAFSDSLKRAAVKWGVGRYLYHLPSSWVDYDPQSRRIVTPPALPSWALPPQAKVDHFASGLAIMATAAEKGIPEMDLAWKTLSPEMQKALKGCDELEDLVRKAETIKPRTPKGNAHAVPR